MEERLALMAVSLKELEAKLEGFLQGKVDIPDLYRGQAKRNRDTLAVLAADDDIETIVDTWVSKRKYSKLLELWVKGLNFDWNKLYTDVKPCRVSLPTYPFARESYWIPQVGKSYVVSSGEGVSLIHPLLHRNTSDFMEQRFSSTFTGNEFFLADREVEGLKIIPESIYLEMAREAFVQAAGIHPGRQMAVLMKNIVWIDPVVVGERPVEVHIGLIPEDNEEIDFNIYSEIDEDNEEILVYSHGKIMPVEPEETQRLDIEALKAACSRSVITSTRCYEALRAQGIKCGPAYKVIDLLYAGTDEALVKLVLPALDGDVADKFVLYPGLLSSTVQASAAFMSERQNICITTPLLPAELRELRIFGKCSTEMWAYIRFSDVGSDEEQAGRFDIDLCDKQGKVCVILRGYLLKTQEDIQDKSFYSESIKAACEENGIISSGHPANEDQA
jgi:acyl transferase domain-containing protein